MEKQWQSVYLKDDSWIDIGESRVGSIHLGTSNGKYYDSRTDRYVSMVPKTIERVPSGIEVGWDVSSASGMGSTVMFIPNDNIINITGLRYG